MKLVLHNGEIKEVDTSHIFDNQYNTTDGKRIYDREVRCIIDDIRLGEFYCSSVKQGTYDEVAKAITEERSKINKCNECWWFNKFTTVKDECSTERIREGNRETIIEKRVYDISCNYTATYGKQCIHDIEETPTLFREHTFCFFCEYPKGIPDMKPLKQFMIDNAEKYGIVPYWSDQELSIDNSFTHKKQFGSYKFEANRWSKYFELSNARNHFKFYVDFANKKYILEDGLGYKVADKLTEHKWKYCHETQQSKPYDEPIKNYDKFAEWFWQIVDDFIATQK
jgi:hypothetical protein